jgi:hypothetical protein
MPLEPVVSVSPDEPLANVPLAPEVGAAKLTVNPLTGDPALVTTTENFWPNAVPTTVFCCDPFASDTLRDAEEDDDEFELAQLERTTKAATQAANATLLKPLTPSRTIRSRLRGIAENPAGMRTKPRRLMSSVLVGSDPGFYV